MEDLTIRTKEPAASQQAIITAEHPSVCPVAQIEQEVKHCHSNAPHSTARTVANEQKSAVQHATMQEATAQIGLPTVCNEQPKSRNASEIESSKQVKSSPCLSDAHASGIKTQKSPSSHHMTSTAISSAAKQITPIQIKQIVPNPNQPRKDFSEVSILKLADSIQQFGIIQPLTVRKTGQVYELIAGERRLRAAKELGWQSVPCIITNASEAESAQISIIENLLREDLNIFEQAQAIEALIDTYGLTQEQVALKLSNSQSYIANKLRLLRLTPSERRQIVENKLSERHARAILRIQDENLRQNTLNSIIDQGLNVSKSEELVERLLSATAPNSEQTQSKKQHYKDIPTFFTAICRAIDSAKSSNLGIKSRKIVGDNYTELTIIIPIADKNCQENNK